MNLYDVRFSSSDQLNTPINYQVVPVEYYDRSYPTIVYTVGNIVLIVWSIVLFITTKPNPYWYFTGLYLILFLTSLYPLYKVRTEIGFYFGIWLVTLWTSLYGCILLSGPTYDGIVTAILITLFSCVVFLHALIRTAWLLTKNSE